MNGTAFSPEGIPLSYEVLGTGAPALVFVHGWSCDRRYWSRQLGYFAERYQVVAVDLAGHGQSGGGRASWTMPAFANDVLAVVEQLGLREVVLIGHSMGGDVIVEAALRLPGRVLGLIWADTYSSLGDPEYATAIDKFIVPFREDFVTTTRTFVRRMFLPNSAADLIEWVATDMSAAPPEVALGSMGYSLRHESAIPGLLQQLTVPVVQINPDYRPNDLEALQRHRVKTVLMSGVGHFEMMEDPDTFNRLLGETIEEFGG